MENGSQTRVRVWVFLTATHKTIVLMKEFHVSLFQVCPGNQPEEDSLGADSSRPVALNFQVRFCVLVVCSWI